MIFLVKKMQSNTYAYVRISNFKEAYKQNRKYCSNIDELMSVVNDNKNTPDRCIFEVLENSIRRVYFDIENIPFDQEDIIYKIIQKLAEFMEISPDNYALTLNKGSHHIGLSYHLTFPFKTHTTNILNMLRSFKLKYPEYVEYIDECVYNTNRLFRLPNQYGISKYNEIRGNLAPSKWYYNGTEKTVPNENKYNDVHRIVNGKFEELIIQNISDIPMLNKIFGYVSRKKLPMHNISYPKMTNTVIELMKELNDNNNETVKENISLLKEDLNNSKHKYNVDAVKEIFYVILMFIMFIALMPR